jgi:hypothetical protein
MLARSDAIAAFRQTDGEPSHRIDTHPMHWRNVALGCKLRDRFAREQELLFRNGMLDGKCSEGIVIYQILGQ